jgi:hypothetical protein
LEHVAGFQQIAYTEWIEVFSMGNGLGDYGKPDGRPLIKGDIQRSHDGSAIIAVEFHDEN